LSGITDGDGSFQITIQNQEGKGLTGFKPFLEFKISQKEHSIKMLEEVKNFFNCGKIIIDNRKSGTLKFVVTNINDILTKIIPHFEKFPLVTSKYLNFLDFKFAAFIMAEKKHYKIDGIEELRKLKLYMNNNRPFEDKFNYCWSKAINLHPNWVQGFIDAEGSFQSEFILSK
jgi:hypothetical protein